MEFSAEHRSGHSPCMPRALHQGVQNRYIRLEREGTAQHSFIADHSHLESRVAIDGRDQRDRALGRKVNMLNALTGPAENLGKYQIDRLAAREQSLPVFAG